MARHLLSMNKTLSLVRNTAKIKHCPTHFKIILDLGALEGRTEGPHRPFTSFPDMSFTERTTEG